jgi:hypothetical protein
MGHFNRSEHSTGMNELEVALACRRDDQLFELFLGLGIERAPVTPLLAGLFDFLSPFFAMTNSPLLAYIFVCPICRLPGLFRNWSRITEQICHWRNQSSPLADVPNVVLWRYA